MRCMDTPASSSASIAKTPPARLNTPAHLYRGWLTLSRGRLPKCWIITRTCPRKCSNQVVANPRRNVALRLMYVPCLESDCVHIWRLSLDRPQAVIDNDSVLLSADEAARADRKSTRLNSS